ncbi:streptococcal hemagglutinin-like [Dermacentor albipictus]|uniref:streptococcal hemagglutinin-like n=1 Tax=Dermacentor albipictus TaxID=60249 RepID=UPI0031FE04FD
MRVTIKTPPGNKRAPSKEAKKQQLRPLSRGASSRARGVALNKLPLRDRFLLSFSIPLILVSFSLLTFIAGHVIARMVGRAKARKAEKITADVGVLNASRESTATSEAAISIATGAASLDAAVPPNASQLVVGSGTIPTLIDIRTRKGYPLEGGWRFITIAPKTQDNGPALPFDDVGASSTIRSAAGMTGEVTPAELAIIIEYHDRGKALDKNTATSTTARVMESERRAYISKGPERTDMVWTATGAVYTAAETKPTNVTRAGDTALTASAETRAPAGRSDTPPGDVRGAPGSGDAGGFVADIVDPYHNKDEGITDTKTGDETESSDLSLIGPSPPDYTTATALAPSSTTVLRAADLLDIPAIDDGISVATAVTGVYLIENTSAFITAIDQTDIVGSAPFQGVTRAKTEGEAEGRGTPVGRSATSTPAEWMVTQQTWVSAMLGTPSLSGTRAEAAEQPRARPMHETIRSSRTRVPLEKGALFETTTTTETPGKMITPQYMLTGRYGAIPKDEEFRWGLFNSTEHATPRAASRTEIFVSNERIGNATSQAKAASLSSSTGRNAASGDTMTAIVKDATDSSNSVKHGGTSSHVNEIEETASRPNDATQFRGIVTNDIPTEKSKSTGVSKISAVTSTIPIVATTENQTGKLNGLDKVDAWVETKWSNETTVHGATTPSKNFKKEAISSRISSASESSLGKTFHQQDTAGNTTSSPVLNEYGRTNAGILYTNGDIRSEGTNVPAMFISSPGISRDASMQTTAAGTDVTRVHMASIRKSGTASTVKAKSVLPGYFRTGPGINPATVAAVSAPTDPSFTESGTSRNRRMALSITVVSVSARIAKEISTPEPSTHLRSFMAMSGVQTSVPLPATIDALKDRQRSQAFTIITSPIASIENRETNHREATVSSEARHPIHSVGRNNIIPAMTIQTAMTGNRGTTTTKSTTDTGETGTGMSARVSAFDEKASPTWLNKSGAHIPANATSATIEATENRPTVSTEETSTVTNIDTNGVRKDEKGNVIRTRRTGESQFIATNEAASTGTERNKTAEAKTASNGDGGVTALTTAISAAGIPTRNSEESADSLTTTRSSVLSDPNTETPTNLATPGGSAGASEIKTFPAWRINDALKLNAGKSLTTVGRKTPVIGDTNVAASETKVEAAWRILAAVTRLSVPVMTSAAAANGDAVPRSSAQDAGAGRNATFPAMIIQTAMTGNRATSTTKPAITARGSRVVSSVPMSVFDEKAPPTRLNNSGVRIPANTAGTPPFTAVLETRRFSLPEAMTTDKRILPAWPIRSAVTRHPTPAIAKSSAASRGSSPVRSARAAGYGETMTSPAMLTPAAAVSHAVPMLTKQATDIRKAPIYNIANIYGVDRNPIRTRPVKSATTAGAGASGPPIVAARRKDSSTRHTEARASDIKNTTV